MKSRVRFTLAVGDVLSRPKLPFVHKGVYVGNGLVVHNLPGRGEHISTLRDFANNQPVSVTPLPTHKRPVAWRKAAAVAANPRAYDAITNNCEHTVTRITENREYSSQLRWIGFAIGMGVLTAAVIR